MVIIILVGMVMGDKAKIQVINMYFAPQEDSGCNLFYFGICITPKFSFAQKML